jgi:hypothetical protein
MTVKMGGGKLIVFKTKFEQAVDLLTRISSAFVDAYRDAWETTANYGEFYSFGEDIQYTATDY